jgi:hypothetical protein
MRLRPAWIQTSLGIRAVWSGSMLFAISFSTCNRVGKQIAWILTRLRGHKYIMLVLSWRGSYIDPHLDIFIKKLRFFFFQVSGYCNRSVSMGRRDFIRQELFQTEHWSYPPTSRAGRWNRHQSYIVTSKSFRSSHQIVWI